MRSICVAPLGGCGRVFRGDLPWRLHRGWIDGVRACLHPTDVGLTFDRKTRSWGLQQRARGAEVEALKVRAGFLADDEHEEEVAA